MRYHEPRKKRFLEGKGFYFVLAFCLIAIGAAAWSAYNVFSQLDPIDTASNTSSNQSITQAGADKEDIKKEENSSKQGMPSSSEKQTSSIPVESNSSKPEPPVAKYFVLPVSGNVIKDFSADKLQYSLTYNDRRLHQAVDIAAEKGSSVKSCGDGTIKEIKKDELLGKTIVIDHGNDVIGYYSGLADSIKVKKGDIVKGGQVIASVGNIPSESLDESHLHLAFTKKGEYVSPLGLMGLEDTE